MRDRSVSAQIYQTNNILWAATSEIAIIRILSYFKNLFLRFHAYIRITTDVLPFKYIYASVCY